jgi:hypothetical protein
MVIRIGTRLRSVHPPIRLSALLVLAACNPATTRPDFLPSPQALTSTVDATRQQLVPEIATWLGAAGLAVKARSVLDGYLETGWQRAPSPAPPAAATGTPVPSPPLPVKVRVWVDPYIPGASAVVVEVVYRPFVDPSRPPRELEVFVPPWHPGYVMGEGLIEAMRKRFGVPPGT